MGRPESGRVLARFRFELLQQFLLLLGSRSVAIRSELVDRREKAPDVDTGVPGLDFALACELAIDSR